MKQAIIWIGINGGKNKIMQINYGIFIQKKLHAASPSIVGVRAKFLCANNKQGRK